MRAISDCLNRQKKPRMSINASRLAKYAHILSVASNFSDNSVSNKETVVNASGSFTREANAIFRALASPVVVVVVFSESIYSTLVPASVHLRGCP